MANRKPVTVMTLAIVAAVVAILGYGLFTMAYPAWWGMGGPGAMYRYAPGYSGYAMVGGRGAFGWGWNGSRADLNLSTDAVRTYFERSIAWQGNPRLKVGDVTERDADTIVADIVTVDNSLVERFAVDRRSGLYRPLED